ncbi:rRNA maturation RNase YbeY [Gorillibacterium massiliense]|uniref:rRNA maturation RNase YbeY n=1 Tax=Gorillibacterium massiliense TaxID=1280390 RepID=UPI0004AEB3BB|nr:rRNA maturation RNase YbeY [Gorillibacterium massiliense]
MALNLVCNNEQDEMEITEALTGLLEKLLQIAGAQEGVEHGEVALTFVDDEEIHRLNNEFRNIDRPTDVLSFPMFEKDEDEPRINYDDLEEVENEDGTAPDDFTEEEPLGDIVISIPRAVAQSEEYGHSVERELGFLFIHGFLHLIGYDHESDDEEREMFAKQESILQEAGLTR